MFSFVDRIVECEAGERARGFFTVPPGAGEFPGSLAAEAVGQLAAWAVMARTGFTLRPVAGLTRQIRSRGAVGAGTPLELEAKIGTFREDAISYDGWARAGPDLVLALTDCVCPLLPLADFDDPAAVRERFAALAAAASAGSRIAGGVDPVRFEGVGREGAHGVLAAEVLVPETAPYFAEHFPRKPVFPGTLLLEAMTRLAALAAGAALGREAAPVREIVVHGAKIRAFMPPGARLGFRARTLGTADGEATVAVEVRGLDSALAMTLPGGKVLSSARVSVRLGDPP